MEILLDEVVIISVITADLVSGSTYNYDGYFYGKNSKTQLLT